MSDAISNPLYGKLDEVAEGLVKAKPAPEEVDAESGEDQVVREGGRGARRGETPEAIGETLTKLRASRPRDAGPDGADKGPKESPRG